jgi:hypothetical protein
MLSLKQDISRTTWIIIRFKRAIDDLHKIKASMQCNNDYGCDCKKLHLVNCKNGMTIVAISCTRGNKKALATILLTKYWEKLGFIKI